jgi:hypothetical protein
MGSPPARGRRFRLQGFDRAGGARTVEQLFGEIDALSVLAILTTCEHSLSLVDLSTLRRAPVSYNSHMSSFFKTRTLQAWIACLAILFGSLAPSISHALAAASPGRKQVEICTRGGIMLMSVSATAGTKSPFGLTQDHLQHCPCCLAQDGPFALLPPLQLTFAVIGGHDLFPFLFYDAPQPLFSWSAANPRAPPVTA